MGGDRRLLPAAAGAARRGCSGHALGDPRAVRPARGSRPGRTLSPLRGGGPPGHPRARRAPGCARGGTSSWRASSNAPGSRTTSARSSAWTRARRTCSRRSAPTPAGPPRRPTRSFRCWPPTPACAPSSAAGSPRTGAVSGTGAGGCGCRSAPTRRGWREGSCEAGVRTVCVELTSAFGEGSWEHLQPLAGERGLVLVPIDRSTISLVWSERRLPGRGRLPRLPPPHDLPPQPLEQRRRRVRPRRRAGAGPGRRGGLRDPCAGAPARRRRGGARTAAGRRPGGVRAGHRAAGALVVRGRRLAGGRGRGGRPPGPRARAPRRGRGGGRAAAAARGGGGASGGPSAGAPAETSRRGPRRGWQSSPSGPARPSCEVLAAGPAVSASALRELLALQASDWAFLITRELAVSYARERFDAHRRELARALSGEDPAGVAAGAAQHRPRRPPERPPGALSGRPKRAGGGPPARSW